MGGLIMNYFKEILNHIKVYSKHTQKETEHDILGHLIQLIGEEDFNIKFNVYFLRDENTFEENFYDFHKSMRQTDFYEIGHGHLDMIFWNFIHMSEIPEYVFKTFVKSLKEETNDATRN